MTCLHFMALVITLLQAELSISVFRSGFAQKSVAALVALQIWTLEDVWWLSALQSRLVRQS